MRTVVSYIAVCLLLVLLFQQNGWIILHQWERKMWQENVSQRIENQKDEVQVLRFSYQAYQQLIWEETEKEFWHQGKLYDVIKVEKQANEVLVFAISDAKEYFLIEKYIHQIKELTQAEKHRPTKIPYLITHYLPTHFYWEAFVKVFSNEPLCLFDENSKALCDLFPPIPPPEKR
ncbi:MAG: hypothetical protein ACKVTZ_01150 [Bacteroidia bacterium]